MREVYITSTGMCLPGDPVPNEEILDYLGAIDSKSSRLGSFVLRLNGIKQRHYAIDKSQKLLFSNAGLAARAVNATLEQASIPITSLEMLNTATTLPDLLVPGHASSVHGELGGTALDIASFNSVCASAMMAVKSAWLNVGSGLMDNAIAVGSDISSIRFRPDVYLPAKHLLEDKQVRMSAEFLRWTLSDGAGAAFFEPRPRKPLSLRVDRIVTQSFAHKFDVCMYAGITPENKKDLTKSWSTYPGGVPGAATAGAVMLLQDMALLKDMLEIWAEAVGTLVKEEFFTPDSVDWMLCHYSAESLRDEFRVLLKDKGVEIASEKWWSNLSYRGNIGAASPFTLLHDFLGNKDVSPGDTIFFMVPESGRALVSFMHLTVV